MELAYYPSIYFGNGMIEGILTICKSQELDIIERMDLQDHIEEEFETSFDIDITLSTDQGLNQKMSELYNNLRTIKIQINCYKKQIDRQIQLLNMRKFNNNDFTDNISENYDQYFTNEENIIRSELDIDYWNERIEYEKVNGLILTIQGEFQKRKLKDLQNEDQYQKENFDQQTEILYNKYYWNIQNTPYIGLTTESLTQMLSILDSEYKTQLKDLKNDQIDATNLRNQKSLEIENKIKDIERLISESINYQEEYNEFLLEALSDIETKYQYPDENSL
jgi:hypothetical protein